MKRILSFAVAAAVCLALQVTAFGYGFMGDEGEWSDSKVPFRFMNEKAVMVSNGDVDDDPYYGEAWPGASIYIPIAVIGGSGDDGANASAKEIKDNKVAVAYKATMGDPYVDSVTVVEGKKEKIQDLPAGMYAKVQLTDTYTREGSVPIRVNLVLSVNKLSYPKTEITLDMRMINRQVEIHRNTVYTAHTPTQFKVRSSYNGSATFDFGDDVRYNAKVTKKSLYYLNLDKNPNTAIANMYPDAYLEFYNFVGDRDTFANNGTLEIPVNRSKFTPRRSTNTQVFVYEIKNDTLVALDESTLSFDKKTDTLTLKTKTLKNYVLSNQALMKTVDNDEDNVIYTGYAQPESASSQETATQQTGTSSSQSGASQASSGTAQTSTINDNVNTGISINANNRSADNPPTSDGPLRSVLLLAAASGTVAAGTRRNKKKPKNDLPE